MKATVNTYDNRIEVALPIPDGLESVEGGATIQTDGDGNRRAVWVFGSDTDPKQAATECVLLLIASSPGSGVDPESERPVKTQSITVTP